MRVGIITGSGSYAWPGLTGQRSRQVETGYGAADVTVGRFVGVDVVHLSRREPGSAQAGASGLVKVSRQGEDSRPGAVGKDAGRPPTAGGHLWVGDRPYAGVRGGANGPRAVGGCRVGSRVRAAHVLHDRSAWESSSSGWWRVEGTRRILPFAGTERFPGGNRVTMDGACWAGIDRRRHLPSSSSLPKSCAEYHLVFGR